MQQSNEEKKNPRITTTVSLENENLSVRYCKIILKNGTNSKEQI